MLVLSPARASAFLEPANQGQIITTTTFSDSTRAFDKSGNLIPVASYRKFELSAYLEYGITDWLTAVASPSLDWIRDHSNPPAAYEGYSGSAVGARIALFQSAETVVSFQGLLRVPTFIAADHAAGTREGVNNFGPDLRLMLGHSFNLFQRPTFIDFGGGYVMRGSGLPNEWRLDATAGLRVKPDLLILAQSFAALSDGASALSPHYFWDKLQLSFVYDITSKWSVQAGLFMTVAGVNAGREFGPIAAIWYRF